MCDNYKEVISLEPCSDMPWKTAAIFYNDDKCNMSHISTSHINTEIPGHMGA